MKEEIRSISVPKTDDEIWALLKNEINQTAIEFIPGIKSMLLLAYQIGMAMGVKAALEKITKI